jgi:hypothetical protein
MGAEKLAKFLAFLVDTEFVDDLTPHEIQYLYALNETLPEDPLLASRVLYRALYERINQHITPALPAREAATVLQVLNMTMIAFGTRSPEEIVALYEEVNNLAKTIAPFMEGKRVGVAVMALWDVLVKVAESALRDHCEDTDSL